jgi:hypothetical protein
MAGSKDRGRWASGITVLRAPWDEAWLARRNAAATPKSVVDEIVEKAVRS